MTRRGEDYRKLINSRRWRRLRTAELARHPLCADCAAEGYVTAATEVHHLVPVESGRDEAHRAALAYDPANLMALCAGCHRRRHERAELPKKEETKRRTQAETRQTAKDLWGVEL